MPARDRPAPRSDVVGSLLRPDYLLQARRDVRAGRISAEALRSIEDRAVHEAIELQQAAGLEVITDGEFRRNTWVALIPLMDDQAFVPPISGFEFLETDAGWWKLWKEPDGSPADFGIAREPFVTERIAPARDIVHDEYAFLARNAKARTKFSIPAPSWHRIFWHREHSSGAYPSSDEFIADMARFLREEIVAHLIELGCDYIQLDAPNYAQWHVDPVNRAAFEAHGHDMAHELIADAELDNSVFAGVEGVTRAIHVCRGNGPRGRYLASGGYEVIADRVFPRWTNIDRLMLEYDSDRAGGFEPLAHVLPQHEVVLGLVTTKSPQLEDAQSVGARIGEAAKRVPLERLAVSPQCGFASGEIADTMTIAEQEAKLRLVSEVARGVWG